MSFVEKIVGGVALMMVQKQMPDPVTVENGVFFELILAYGCGGAALFGILIIMALWPFEVGKR